MCVGPYGHLFPWFQAFFRLSSDVGGDVCQELSSTTLLRAFTFKIKHAELNKTSHRSRAQSPWGPAALHEGHTQGLIAVAILDLGSLLTAVAGKRIRDYVLGGESRTLPIVAN